MQLLTDNNAAPWFLPNVICIWLRSLEALDLHRCHHRHDLRPEGTPPQEDALMGLLRQFA